MKLEQRIIQITFHQIMEVKNNEQRYITQGDSNSLDVEPVLGENIMGNFQNLRYLISVMHFNLLILSKGCAVADYTLPPFLRYAVVMIRRA